MTLLERTAVHEQCFRLEGERDFYCVRGTGPDAAGDRRVPQRTRCTLRRILTNRLVLDRRRVPDGTLWRVPAPARIVTIELRGERLCFRMRHLAFFERSLRLSTGINTQIPWLAFESPLVSCIEGHGILGLRFEGAPDLLAADTADAAAPRRMNLPRMAAWSADTRLQLEVCGDLGNTVTAAPATAVIRASSLVVGGREDPGGASTVQLLRQVLRLIVP